MKDVLAREILERYQVLLYIAVLLVGGGLGLAAPGAAAWLEGLVWPALAVVLYATFCQVRPADSVRAFRHGRFFVASLIANFALVPAIVWALALLLPPNPAIRLGVFMVLLVPCTDWFVTFSHLAQGDTRLAMAVVPIQLLVQSALLPLYLWLFMGRELIQVVAAGPFLQAFLGLIVVPFALAVLTQYWGRRHSAGNSWLRTTAWLPVPFLALVLFLIAASQLVVMGDAVTSLGWTALVFVLYLAAVAPLARLVALAFRLEMEAGRTLAFNVGTRNSFVVLPLALALPPGWEAAVATIVLQSLVELSGIIAYLWWVPRYFFPAARPI